MNIYLTFEREKKLRLQAERVGKNISMLVGEWIDSLGDIIPVIELKGVTSSLQGIQSNCEQRLCMNEAIGKFKVVTDQGESTRELRLCKFHKFQASKEGEVTEL